MKKRTVRRVFAGPIGAGRRVPFYRGAKLRGAVSRAAARLRSGRRGLTLVEVLVSIALLAVVTLLAAGLLLTGLRVLGFNMPRSQISQKAAEKVENASPDSGISASSGTFTIRMDDGSSGAVNGTYRSGAESAAAGGAVSYWTFSPDSGPES